MAPAPLCLSLPPVGALPYQRPLDPPPPERPPLKPDELELDDDEDRVTLGMVLV